MNDITVVFDDELLFWWQFTTGQWMMWSYG